MTFQVGARVGCHDDQRVLEIDVAAFAIGERALVEHLVEHVLDPRMGLFHFVEQHDAVRLASDRLGQDATLAVTDVSGR